MMYCMCYIAIVVTYCIYQVSYADDGGYGSEDEFRLVEKVSGDVFVAAVADVVKFKQGKEPEECARDVHKHGLLEAWC